MGEKVQRPGAGDTLWQPRALARHSRTQGQFLALRKGNDSQPPVPLDTGFCGHARAHTYKYKQTQGCLCF